MPKNILAGDALSHYGAPRPVPVSAVISLDLGASFVKTRLIHRDRGMEQGRVAPINSAGSLGSILATVASTVHLHRRSAPRAEALGLAVALPGKVDHPAGIAQYDPEGKYGALAGRCVAEDLSSCSGVPSLRVVVINDSEAALLAEIAPGPAPRSRHRILGLTLGTDLGIAYAVNGVVIPTQSWRDVPVASSAGTCARPAGISTRDLQCQLDAGRGPRGSIVNYARLVRAGDLGLRKAFHLFGCHLGKYIGSFIQSLRVDSVVVSGGLAGSYDLFSDGLEMATRLRIFRGRHGAAAGVAGAAAAWR